MVKGPYLGWAAKCGTQRNETSYTVAAADDFGGGGTIGINRTGFDTSDVESDVGLGAGYESAVMTEGFHIDIPDLP